MLYNNNKLTKNNYVYQKNYLIYYIKIYKYNICIIKIMINELIDGKNWIMREGRRISAL